MKGLLIAAPHTGSGKTIVTLGLLRALAQANVPVGAAKCGPDFIDTAWLEAASGQPAFNLDPWAMRRDLISALASRASEGGKLLVVEGMMGLYDAASSGKGATADIAAALSLPVILVVDCARMSHSVAAIVRGFREHSTAIDIAGVILNRVGGPRHEAMLRDALGALRTPVLGVIPREAGLELPSRHLGLRQAADSPDRDAFLDRCAEMARTHLDLGQIIRLTGRYPQFVASAAVPRLKAPGRRLAIARDAAFSFGYAHLLQGWQRQGVEVSFFSPLADEAPDETADAVCLPGGYPELHAASIAKAGHFRAGMEAARARGAVIFGECGGYMVLGQGLTDADGVRHPMLGFLGLETSFAKRKMHLGYRQVRFRPGLGFRGAFNAHEFHYTSIVAEEGVPVFDVRDALGDDLGTAGLVAGRVYGSFMHLIDIADAPVSETLSQFDEDD
ncbi:MAG: cobyrinate a,c-diamide synthase [Rhizobiaceae bacterium]|jgi:cobyrinic acid a,c-diamide synthase|nr:cobyrinate a,c-diamide synthase [Rhizobiaceae bacterium]